MLAEGTGCRGSRYRRTLLTLLGLAQAGLYFVTVPRVVEAATFVVNRASYVPDAILGNAD